MKTKRKWLALIIGSIIISIGINNFFVPLHILDGGIIGVGLIVNYKYGIHIGAAILLLSIPIYICAWLYYRNFFYNSIAGFIASALFIDGFHWLRLNVEQLPPISCAIIGGFLLGIGVGTMLFFNISTGGLDLFALMLGDLVKANAGIIIFIIDLAVVLAGFAVLSTQEMLLSVIAITTTGVTTTTIVSFKDK